ncbi:hemerythrin domain-containing protein, partial [Jatrophihabitans endophyticus]|uniref:hemerythrin domain-containing protein n=1 Tax=Jatrophihabitans endophyticus TaxID=1206085 RepID=UPI001A026B66
HHEVLALIDTIDTAPDAATRRDIADTVIAEIVRHSVAEEMFVYPAMRRYLPDGDAVVQQDIDEHQQLEQTLKRLERADVNDPQFAALVGEVRDELRAHAADEETEQFPLLRAHLPVDTLADLGRKVETAKLVAPTRPHPKSPHAELFHKAFGPGVGFVDKLRDAVSGRARNT